MSAVAKNLHLRGLPEDVHRVLVDRAAEEGKSLNSYLVEVLSEHVGLPTMSEWLASVPSLGLRNTKITGAEAVRAARHEDEEQRFRAVRRR